MRRLSRMERSGEGMGRVTWNWASTPLKLSLAGGGGVHGVFSSV